MKDAYACGTPKQECDGSPMKHNAMLASQMKLHGERLQAFNCMKRWLLRQGYKQVGNREFQLGDGPIRVLTKKSSYGKRLRPGKEGRVMATRGRGHVVSC